MGDNAHRKNREELTIIETIPNTNDFYFLFKIFHGDKWACILILRKYYSFRLGELEKLKSVEASSTQTQTQNPNPNPNLEPDSTTLSPQTSTTSSTTNPHTTEELTFLTNILDHLLHSVLLQKQLLPYVDFENSVVFQPTMTEEQKDAYERILNPAPKEPTHRPPWRYGGSPVEDGYLPPLKNTDGTYIYETPATTPNTNNNGGTVIINGEAYGQKCIPVSKTTLNNDLWGPKGRYYTETKATQLQDPKTGGSNHNYSKTNMVVAGILLCLTVAFGVANVTY